MMHDSTRRSTLWTQAANIRRKFEWQHGHGAVGKVNAGAAQMSFVIQGRAWRNVVGHVRDVDLQFEVAFFQLVDGDSVIEITGGLTVNSNDGGSRGNRGACKASAARDDRFGFLSFFKNIRRKKCAGDGICG